jgi:membrane-associated protease RseP (regulator of RpoE activity)
VLLLRKTQWGKGFLIRLGTRFPRFWLAVGSIAVIVTLLSSIWIIWLLLIQTQMLAAGEIEMGPGVLLPSPTNQTTIGPGYFAVPFWYWIISIAVLVIVHEGMHGIMAARERVKIKSLGWGLLAVIPLAFVEPDEKQLQKQKAWKQMRVFAAGSFANFIVAIISVAGLAFLTSSVFMHTGVGFQAVAQGYPAANANMTGTIIKIDSQEVTSSSDLGRILQVLGPNRTITIMTTNGTDRFSYTLETASEPEPAFKPDFFTFALVTIDQALPGAMDASKSISNSYAYVTGGYREPSWSSIKKEVKLWEYAKATYTKSTPRADIRIQALMAELESHPPSGFIGVVGIFESTEIKPGLEGYQESVTFLEGLLFFMFLINFGVGTFNMLPIGPLDGGRMWGIVFGRITPKHAKKIMAGITWIILLIIIANFAFVLF